MRIWHLILLSFVFVLASCSAVESEAGKSHGEHAISHPPEAQIEIDGEVYPTVLGTYCWSYKNTGECVDTAGPVELLKGEAPIETRPGEEIKFVISYIPEPNEFHLMQLTEDGREEEVKTESNVFKAPEKSGTYYYSYGVWWMDEERENVSNGDAFYNFALEVIGD